MKTSNDYKKTDFGYDLDDDEAELLRAMAEGDFQPVAHMEKRKVELQQAAAEFNQMKRKSINIRIPEYNLKRLRAQASRQGMPYQTLINSILQQYLEQEQRKAS